MLGTFVSVALLVAVASPLLLAAAWRVPFGALSVSMVVRAALRGGTYAVLFGLAAHIVIAGLGGVPDPEASGYAASLGGMLAIAVVGAGFTRKRTQRGALLLSLRARDPSTRTMALPALHGLLDRARSTSRPRAVERYAEVVLLIVPPLTQAGLWEDAERLLEGIEAAALRPRTQALRGQALATCRLERGDVRGARDALASVTEPSDDPEVDAWLFTTEALVCAVDGEPEQALSLLARASEDGNPLLRASRRIVRAHAEAALGREEAARAELERTREEIGPAALERALTPEGPASELARSLLGRPTRGQSG